MPVNWYVGLTPLGRYEIRLFDEYLNRIDHSLGSYTSHAEAAHYAPSVAKQYETPSSFRSDQR